MVIGLLSGCKAEVDTDLTQINQTQVYEGYPCHQYCNEFQKGFNEAKDKTLTNPSQCSSQGEKVKVGCLAWVQEYKSEHESEFEL